jgi:hypothetical protein
MTTATKHEAKKNALHDPADDDLDLGYLDERPVLIPEGEYEVGFRRASTRFKGFGRDNVYLYFQIITPGEHVGLELYLPLRVSPQKGCTAMAPSSALARAVAVALGHPASRRDRITLKVFKGKAFRVSVETIDRDSKKRKLPPVNHYSRIAMLLERTAGA